MSLSVFVFLTVLIFFALPMCCDCWKPIVGSSKTPFTSSFSLKQSHPEIASSASSIHVSHGVNSEEVVAAELSILPESGKFSLSSPHELTVSSNNDATMAYHTYTNDQYNYDSYGDNGDISASHYGEEHCSVKKYAFNYDGTAYYKNKVPELNQFTICFWLRFTNHTGDHVILTYAAKNETREIQFWVANSQNSSFISMAIKGQQVYRLNYPLRMRQWHHKCTSWNGKTGEWQVWLKSERIGRGFHNALVGHKIPANGKLFSGGPSITGVVSQGLHFEITLLQIYRIALSAGKAHRDHKHHHAHHFDHEGQEISTTTKVPPVINRPQPMHTLLANGQIPSRVRINLAQPSTQGQQIQQTLPQGTNVGSFSQQTPFSIHTNFINGQINEGSRLLSQQLIGLRTGSNHQLLVPSPGSENMQSLNPANVQFIDETDTRVFFKREVNDTIPMVHKTVTKRETKPIEKNGKYLQKRGLVLLNDGSIIDDPSLQTDFKYEGLAEFGGQQFKHDLSLRMNIDDEVATHDQEPAEDEVKAVMGLCSACDNEPFQGAIVFSWKNVKEELDNALRGYSVGRCGNF